MSEYIIHYKDAETLYEHTDFPFLLEEYLREPIVRCRDCKFYTHDELGDYCTQFDFGFVMKEFPRGFCAWGEPKKTGDEDDC